MKLFTYNIHLQPEPEGGYTVTVPSLPGCVTFGSTYDQAIAMAQEAIGGFLEALVKAGQVLPPDDVPNTPVVVDVVLPIKIALSA